MSVPGRIQQEYMLTAGESDAEGLMPVTLLAERIIEIATVHANALGIGYAVLIEKNVGWVLSRLSIEMRRYPRINECYTIATWVESYNRRFSERNFEISTPAGEVLGYARSVWVPMDFARRSAADLSLFDSSGVCPVDLPCPMEKAPRLAALPPEVREENYTFRFCDLDFNRHVNTVRYIDLILDFWPLAHYDAHTVARIDLYFHKECHFGEEISLRVSDDVPDGVNVCEIVQADGTRAVTARLVWQKI